MFGRLGPQTNSILRRCITRSNPERKRPGPVKLFAVSRALPYASISIELDGRAIAEPDELKQLILNIQQVNFPDRDDAATGSTPEPDSEAETQFLKSIFREECVRVLSDLTNFNRPQARSALTEINQQSLFRQLAGGAFNRLLYR